MHAVDSWSILDIALFQDSSCVRMEVEGFWVKEFDRHLVGTNFRCLTGNRVESERYKFFSQDIVVGQPTLYAVSKRLGLDVVSKISILVHLRSDLRSTRRIARL